MSARLRSSPQRVLRRARLPAVFNARLSRLCASGRHRALTARLF